MRNLGVVFDANMSMVSHVSALAKSVVELGSFRYRKHTGTRITLKYQVVFS